MDTPTAGLDDVLGPHYRIQRELGRGGMATVYLAEDLKHGRLVALKVLHPQFAASLGPDRFRREITLAARLQHPHIVSVFDSGETPTGLLWYTMPYVVGESLRDRLIRERQLSVDETVRITRQIADALQYAHIQGVLHRDVKPENILLSGEHSMLADFGVARTLAHAETSDTDTDTGSLTLTHSGFTVGTPAYMSPEQASGERAIDARSDQYALAAVAYEMLAGEPPFSAPTPQAAIAKMLASPPPSIRVVRKDVPIGVGAALTKALGTAPAARYSTVADFATAFEAGLHTGTTDLRPHPMRRTAAIVTAALAFVAAAATTMYLRAGHRGPVMLAVLPFETAGDTADAWITDGITDEVRGKLAGLTNMRVIARSSSNQYRRSTKTPVEIGRELGVRYLLTGRIRWANEPGQGRRIRVEPELVQVADVRTPETRWGEPLEERASDVFRLQSDIAERVASALQLAIDPAEKAAIHRAPTRDSTAYYAYLRSRLLVRNHVPDDERRAINELRHAIQLDSNYVDAWYDLALDLISWAARHPMNAAFVDSARDAAQHAAALESRQPGARGALAYYEEITKHDFARAYADYRAALEHAPSDELLLSGLARAEMRLGKWDSAVAHSEQDVQVNPRNVFANAALGNVYLLTRHYDQAERSCGRATALNPANVLAVFCDIQVPLARGDLAASRAAIRAASPAVDSTFLYVFLASYGGYTWVLDSAQRHALLMVPPSSFDRGRSTWAMTHTLIHDQLGDSASTKAYADTAGAALKTENGPAVADSDASYAWMLAVAGHRSDAIAEADRYLAVHPVDADFLDGPDNAESAVKAYIRAGANDKALNLLDHLLHIPGRLTPGRLRLDPAFTPLKNDPRFQRLSSTPAAGEKG